MSFICPFTNFDLLDKNINFSLWERMARNSYSINIKRLLCFSCKTIEEYIELIKKNKDNNEKMQEIYNSYKEKQIEKIKKLENDENKNKDKLMLDSIYYPNKDIKPIILIRLLSENDKSYAYDLYKEYKINANEYKNDEEIKEFMDDFILKYLIYGIFEDDKLVGCVIKSTKEFKINTFYIQEIFINIEYKGKKYGDYLFNYIINKCPDDINYISFMTKPDNIAMYRLANKYDFELQTTTSGDIKNPSLFIKKIK